jgi:hypothetical protein
MPHKQWVAFEGGAVHRCDSPPPKRQSSPPAEGLEWIEFGDVAGPLGNVPGPSRTVRRGRGGNPTPATTGGPAPQQKGSEGAYRSISSPAPSAAAPSGRGAGSEAQAYWLTIVVLVLLALAILLG